MRDKLSVILVTGVLILNIADIAAQDNDDIPQEKCYCIAKAGRNDCANYSHSCAGLATKDFDCSEWMYVASGSCKEVGGMVEGK